jgi:DNA excision repair protein ERCC-3
MINSDKIYIEMDKKVSGLLNDLGELQKRIDTEKEEISKNFSSLSEGLQMLNFNSEKVKDFWEQPYAIVPRKANEWYVIAPSFVDFHIGWLEKTVMGWNYFIVNQYATWLSDVPKELKEKFNFKETIPLTLTAGVVSTKDSIGKEEVKRRYRKFVRDKGIANQLNVKKGYEFNLMASMIADGILPFTAKKVIDVKEPKMDFMLRDYQQEAWDRFLEVGSIGVFWPYGAGKTFFGMYALASLKGPRLVVVPTTTLKEQWEQNIRQHLPSEELSPEWASYPDGIKVITYSSYKKVSNKSFKLIIFDEAHRLPANTFSRLATLKTEYRIGLSATPYREDGRTNYIFALTGFPTGLSWDKLIKEHTVNTPVVTLYIMNGSAISKKIAKVRELLDERKTIIYSYWLDLGRDIASSLDVPFVYGGTKNRLDVLKSNNIAVMSSVGGEGISIPELERIIEIGFQFGSRREEGQLMGRLFHSQQKDPEHIIIMTDDEYERYSKRLNAIYEKGFRIRVVRG